MTVVPFGKHKGKTIEQVMAEQPTYFDWLASQAWAVEKFQYLIDEARGLSGPPDDRHNDDSPAHNAMQARFLDDVFCVATFAALDNISVAMLQETYAHNVQTGFQQFLAGRYDFGGPDPAANFFDPGRWNAISNTREEPPSEHIRALIRHRHDSATDQHLKDFLAWMIRPGPIYKKKLTASAAFEGFTDVFVSLEVGNNQGLLLAMDAAVEIKPEVGDNFPAYIRQIKAQAQRGAAMQRVQGYGRALPKIALLYGQFTATNLSEAQVRQMFERSGIPTVKLSEVEAKLDEARKIIDVAHGRA